MAAKRKARRGWARPMGSKSKSGGMGKKLASAKAMAASQ
jgi:hypothetical protein